MLRYMLNHSGQRIALPDGVTVVGRGLKCDIRFNDPAVSREHLKVIVSAGRAVVVNLSGSNGTLLNRKRIERAQELRHGDQIAFGYRRFVVEVAEQEPSTPLEGAERDDVHAPVDAEELAEESTRPGEQEGWRQRAPSLSRLAAIERHNCPRCRAMISFGSDSCDQCGYSWPAGHPSSVTQEILIEKVNERRDPRFAVEVPVIYVSAGLTVEATVRDLSRGGMFIATDLLDPIGTACELTVLPEGYAAMTFGGVVAHVAADPGRGRGETGLGIRFDGGRPEAYEWLEATLSRHGADQPLP